jgi:hypothetical protein
VLWENAVFVDLRNDWLRQRGALEGAIGCFAWRLGDPITSFHVVICPLHLQASPRPQPVMTNFLVVSVNTDTGSVEVHMCDVLSLTCFLLLHSWLSVQDTYRVGDCWAA